MTIGEVIVLAVAGLWAVAGAVFNWPWFLNFHRNWLRISFEKEPGWHGRRVFYLILGSFLVILAIVGTIGIIIRGGAPIGW